MHPTLGGSPRPHALGPEGLQRFRRRVMRSAAALLAVGNLLLTVLFLATDRMSGLAIGLMLTSVALHAVAAVTVGRSWDPGDRWSIGYVSSILLFVAIGIGDAAAVNTDGAWFMLVPVGLASIMLGGRVLVVFFGAVVVTLLAAFAVGPGLDAASLLPRMAAFGVFALALRSVSLRVEVALSEAQAARDELAAQIVAERAVNDRLRELDLLKDDFVSTASHELRTPLAVILGMAQTLATHWERLEEPHRREMVGRIESHASGLGGIVATMLDTARLDHGSLPYSPGDADVHALVAGSLARCEPLLRHHDITADVAADGEVLRVEGDARLLERVVDNLLSNAARHTPVGTAVRIGARRVPEGVELLVADDGPGIPTHEVASIGQRFFRSGDPDVRVRDGVGLGLALVRDVLRTHGCELLIASDHGHGAVFSFVLPESRGREPVVADADQQSPVPA